MGLCVCIYPSVCLSVCLSVYLDTAGQRVAIWCMMSKGHTYRTGEHFRKGKSLLA